MKISRLFIPMALAMSLVLSACSSEDVSSISADPTNDPSAGSETTQTMATNESASAEDAVTNFMTAFVHGGYAEAKAYVAPSEREASPLLSTWNNESFIITDFSKVLAGEPFGGMTNVTFYMKGTLSDRAYEANGGLDTAEIDGVWWIVPYNYKAE